MEERMPDHFERASAPDVAVDIAADVAGDMAADAEPVGVHCFICQLDTRACEVAALEGALVSVTERLGGQRIPGVRLRLSSGEQAVVRLNEHARPLISALASIEPERIRGLQLRIYHLWRGLPAESGEYTRYLTDDLSVVTLEPDLLLNITDI